MSQGLVYQAEVEKCNTMEEKFSSLSSLTNTFTTDLCPFKKKTRMGIENDYNEIKSKGELKL